MITAIGYVATVAGFRWRSRLMVFNYMRENGLVFTVAMLDVN